MESLIIEPCPFLWINGAYPEIDTIISMSG